MLGLSYNCYVLWTYISYIIFIVRKIFYLLCFNYTRYFVCWYAYEKTSVLYFYHTKSGLFYMGPNDLVEKNVLPTAYIGSNFKYIINNNKTQRMPHRTFHDFLLISRFILLRCTYVLYHTTCVLNTKILHTFQFYFFHKYFRLFIHLVCKMCALLFLKFILIVSK